MKNYENRLKAIQKIADSKTAQVVSLDFRNGKYYKSKTDVEVDINSIRADVILVDDIPDIPPESLKGSEEDCRENEFQMKK